MSKEKKIRGRSSGLKLKRAALCAILLVLAVLLCSCMKMHIDIVWNEDNSASISTTIALTKSALSMMEITDAEIRQQLKESLEDDGEDYSFKDYSDSEYTGIVATMNVKDITKDSSANMDGLTFESTGSGNSKTYKVSGKLSGSDIAGDSEDMAENGIALDSIDMKITIKMPGKITSNNATEVKGNVLTWVLDPTSTTTLSAVSEGGGGGGSLPLILLIVGIVVLVGVAVVALLLIRKNKAAQTAPYAYGGPAAGYDPYQPQGAQQPQYQQPQQPQYQQPQYQPAEQPQYQPPPSAPPQPQYQPPQYEQPQYQPAEQPQYQPPPPPPPPQFTLPEQPQYQPPPPQPEQPQYQPPAPVITRCPQCGAELAENAKFCTTCGARTS